MEAAQLVVAPSQRSDQRWKAEDGQRKKMETVVIELSMVDRFEKCDQTGVVLKWESDQIEVVQQLLVVSN